MNSIKESFNLKGKVAIVTGSSKGIGKSIAQGLAEHGAKVVISSRSQEAVDEVAAQFKKANLEAIGIACHIGKSEQREQLVKKTIEHFGGIDILVNNAAINPIYGPIEEAEESVFDKIMDINVKAPWMLSNLVLSSMKERGGGSIINIASVEAMHPGAGLGLYSTSKAALNEKILNKIEKSLPTSRMGMPDEMAGIICLLASDAGSYMTGGVYNADGGYMIAG